MMRSILFAVLAMILSSCWFSANNSNETAGGVITPNTVAVAFHFLQDTSLLQNGDSAQFALLKNGKPSRSVVLKFQNYSVQGSLDSIPLGSQEFSIRIWNSTTALNLSGQSSVTIDSSHSFQNTVLLNGTLDTQSINIYGVIKSPVSQNQNGPWIIQSTLPWQPISDTLAPNSTVCFKAQGLWTANGTVAPYGPQGTGRLASNIYALPNASEGALLVRVEAEAPIVLGDSNCISTTKGGAIYFAINDALSLTPIPQGNALSDNSGQMTVTQFTNSVTSSSSNSISSSSSISISSSAISSSSSFIKVSSDTAIIQANLPWQQSRLYMNLGDSICLTATGLWTANGSVAPYGPAGSGKIAGAIYALPNGTEGALLAKMPDNQIIEIDQSKCFRVGQTGYISFAINDALSTDPIAQGAALSDNSGSVIVSWTNLAP